MNIGKCGIAGLLNGSNEEDNNGQRVRHRHAHPLRNAVKGEVEVGEWGVSKKARLSE